VKVMQPVRNPKIDTLIKKGKKHLEKEQFEDALRIFDFALKLDGKNENAKLNAEACIHALGN
jgi:hypothetical protein